MDNPNKNALCTEFDRVFKELRLHKAFLRLIF